MSISPRFSTLIPFYPALVSGLLLTLCFPDSAFYLLAFGALCPLMVAMAHMDAKDAFAAGFVAGIVHTLTLIYWLVPALCIFGGLHPMVSVSVQVLLCLYLSLYPAVFAWLVKKINPPAAAFPLACACVWTGLEFVRTHLLTGFPWGVLGYSQYNNPLLVQMADVTGVLGISFVLVMCNGTAAVWIIHIRRSGPADARLPLSRLCISLAVTLSVLGGACAYGMTQIRAIEKMMAEAPHPLISIVQGNIRQDLKWSEKFKQDTVKKYGDLSRKAAESGPELIIWPETALPFYYGRDEALSKRVDRAVQQSGTHFLIGSPAAEIDGKTVRYFNRVYMLDHRARVTDRYDKTHLVPFGEYVPLRDLLFFLDKLTEGAGDYSAGRPTYAPLSFKDHKAGVLICFEILFPGLAAQFVRNGADILTTVTNDAWYGRTSAAAQHFSIAVLRAVENRRSLARAANTGISGFIDPLGRIFDTTGLFEDAVVSRPVPSLTHLSFYTRNGDVTAFACLIAIAAVFMVKGIQNIKRRTRS